MTADRDDLAAILNAHLLLGFGCCQCGWLAEDRFVIPTDQIQMQHRAHVAQMVLQSDWMRASLNNAWESGRQAGRYNYAYPENNPYRADRVDAEDGGR